MKRKYVSPEAIVLLLEISDVIVASLPTTSTENTTPEDELDFSEDWT